MTSPDTPPDRVTIDPRRLDEEGLLCALVLAPSTYSRNRFFGMYEDRKMRSIQRRARLVRGLVRQLARSADAERKVTTVDDGVELELVVPSLGFRRRTRLSAVEHDLVVYLLARAGAPSRLEGDLGAARARVEGALVRLSGLESVES